MGIHAVHRDKAFDDYLVWFGQRTRLQLRPAWTEQDIADIASEDEGNNPMTKLPEMAGKLRSPLR